MKILMLYFLPVLTELICLVGCTAFSPVLHKADDVSCAFESTTCDWYSDQGSPVVKWTLSNSKENPAVPPPENGDGFLILEDPEGRENMVDAFWSPKFLFPQSGYFNFSLDVFCGDDTELKVFIRESETLKICWTSSDICEKFEGNWFSYSEKASFTMREEDTVFRVMLLGSVDEEPMAIKNFRIVTDFTDDITTSDVFDNVTETTASTVDMSNGESYYSSVTTNSISDNATDATETTAATVNTSSGTKQSDTSTFTTNSFDNVTEFLTGTDVNENMTTIVSTSDEPKQSDIYTFTTESLLDNVTETIETTVNTSDGTDQPDFTTLSETDSNSDSTTGNDSTEVQTNTDTTGSSVTHMTVKTTPLMDQLTPSHTMEAWEIALIFAFTMFSGTAFAWLVAQVIIKLNKRNKHWILRKGVTSDAIFIDDGLQAIKMKIFAKKS